MNALKALTLMACCLLTALAHAVPPKENMHRIRFAAFRQPGDDVKLQETLARAGRDTPDFIVINGIKAASEPCSDALYRRRKDMLNEAARPLVVSLAGSDWIGCKGDDGKANEIERLQRLREWFFDGDNSLGMKKTRLVRQSITPKFRGFPENAYWQRGKILFVTVHLPAENNYYQSAAGRNSEFEDRLIANRYWLQRVFNLARLHKMRGIVLFADGNPMLVPAKGNTASRDGFLEMRKQIALLSSRFAGRVLLAHGFSGHAAAQIIWHDNLGIIGVGQDVIEINANPASSRVFAVASRRAGSKGK